MNLYYLFVSQILSIISVACHHNRPACLAGGEMVENFEFPFMAVINHKTMFCSGAIVSEQWVLTAAHCFSTNHIFSLRASDVEVLAGLVNYNVEETQYTQVRHGTVVYVHSKYRVNKVANHDLAIIRVKPFIMTAAVNIIRLSDKGFPINEYVNCTAVGWGEIDKSPGRENTVLHKLKVASSMSAKTCPGLTHWERRKIICLQQNDGKGLCDGDSGGPLICHGELYGIAHQVYKEITFASEGRDMKRCGVTGITHTYMFVCPYLNWIRHYVKNVPSMPPSCYRDKTK